MRTFQNAVSLYLLAVPLTALPTKRQDEMLLSLRQSCGGFMFSKNSLTAQCVSIQGTPVISTADLSLCMGNENGQMIFRFQGNAFETCQFCALDTDTLDLTCDCLQSNQTTESESTINLDSTVEGHVNGVIVQDDGSLACRSFPG